RQPGASPRTRPAQRRLDGRRRVGSPPRCLVSLEGQRARRRTPDTRGPGRDADARIGGHRVALLKPETYMNESGRSISAATRFYKTPTDGVLVVHDDVDLEFGRFQAREGGGLAGHNGLRSIAQSLGDPGFL